MKKLFVLFILLTAFAFGQSNVVTARFTDLLEATAQTKYVELGQWSRVDSISLSLAGTGEVDIDSVNVYLGYKVPGGKSFFSSTAYTFLTDPNIAASTDFWTDGCGVAADKDAATVLTSAVLRHAPTSLKVVIPPADGSAAGNTVYAIFTIIGIPKDGS